MILDVGEKVHIVERRYFTEDQRRQFVGEVVRCSENAVRVKGYLWVFDPLERVFVRKTEERDRVISLIGNLKLNVIPAEVDLSEIKFVGDTHTGMVVTDGKKFNLDVSEFTMMR